MNSAAGTVPEMVYAVSHDIGEPMREVIGFAQLLARRAPQSADPKFWDELSHVEHGAQRAREMLEALCEFLQAEELEPRAGFTHLDDLAARVLAETEEVRATYPADIDIEMHGSVMSYPDEMRRIIAELVTNAVRFGRSDAHELAHVAVSARCTDAGVELSVEDHGPGIPSDAQDRALQLFQRLHRRSELDTLGVGLALIRRRVHACGGTIELGQTSAGQGLRVDVTLPAPIVDLREPTDPDHQPHDLAS